MVQCRRLVIEREPWDSLTQFLVFQVTTFYILIFLPERYMVGLLDSLLFLYIPFFYFSFRLDELLAG